MEKTKFKPGDEVRLIVPGILTDKNGMTKNGVYTVAKVAMNVANEEILRLNEYPDVKLFARRFELVSRPKKKAKKADWSFVISHPNALNAEEIADTLDENRLVAVVTSDDPEVCCCIFVHRRIVRKANLLSIRQSKPCMTTCRGHIVFALSHAKYIKDVMAWVKRVRQAQWPEKKPVKLSVRYPEV